MDSTRGRRSRSWTEGHGNARTSGQRTAALTHTYLQVLGINNNQSIRSRVPRPGLDSSSEYFRGRRVSGNRKALPLDSPSAHVDPNAHPRVADSSRGDAKLLHSTALQAADVSAACVVMGLEEEIGDGDGHDDDRGAHRQKRAYGVASCTATVRAWDDCGRCRARAGHTKAFHRRAT